MPFFLPARIHPGFIAPTITREIEDQRSCLGPVLTKKSEWIALQKQSAMRRLNFKFVMRALAHPRQKNLPDTAPNQLAHRMHTPIPGIEIPHYGYTLRIGRPDVKGGAANAVNLVQVGAQLVIDFE